AKYGSRYL
ncbi:hypothetical protein BV202_01153B, partial [Haemophilus influenzae]